jgi:arginine decarboxylase
MEAIVSVCHAGKGVTATAGIICGWLYDENSGSKYGGIVSEHSGNYDNKELRNKLEESLNELYHHSYARKSQLKEVDILEESFVPEKKYGTALVGICFTSYYFPVLNK